MRTFYLGVDRANWLWSPEFDGTPLFLSHVTLRRRKSPFPRSRVPWALDSGGFSELDRLGQWETTPQEYVEAVTRYVNEIGSLDWASPQDWMVEPWMLAKTGLSVVEHQKRTVENYLTLRTLAPELPFIPVIQGWELDDYLYCLDLYDQAGVDLRTLDRVGIGSVCRRQSTDGIGDIFRTLQTEGISCHGYGVKSAGLKRYGRYLASADSMAWSYGARRNGTNPNCPRGATRCHHCPHFALSWRRRLLGSLTP